MEKLSIYPYSFYSDDADTGLGEGKDIVPPGWLRVRDDGVDGHKDVADLELSDVEDEGVTTSKTTSARASLPALRTLTMGVNVPDELVCALRDWLPLQQLTAMISFENKREEPSAYN